MCVLAASGRNWREEWGPQGSYGHIPHLSCPVGFPGGEHWECGQGPTHRKFTAGDEDSKQADGLEPRVTGTEATAPKRRAFTPYEPWPGACGIAGLGRCRAVEGHREPEQQSKIWRQAMWEPLKGVGVF